MENPRIDYQLPDGSQYTCQTMPNGEVRTRLRIIDGPTTTVTKGPDWLPGNEPLPWQDGHYHRGLWETYTLVSGWVYFVLIDQNVKTSCLEKLGQTLTFKPSVQHLVLPGPKSVMLTSTYGDEVRNPDRGNNDWWPVDDAFSKRAAEERGVVESIVQTMFR